MSNKSKAIYDGRPAGFGKTWEQLNRICCEPALYVFAVDRVEIVAERRKCLEDMASAVSARVHIEEVHHEVVQGSVRVALEALAGTFTSGHVVAFVTHAGLMSANLERFEDWHCIVDETPSLWDRCSLQTSISASLLPELFDLEEAEVGSRILPRARLSRREIQLDSLAGPLATLHSRASSLSNTVMTHLRSWDELRADGRWTWWSLWSPAALQNFASLTMLAAAFERSLTFELCKVLAPEIEWSSLASSAGGRPYAPRPLEVRYFAEEHHASRHRFGSPNGIDALHKIAGHLSLRPQPRIWTCNSPDLSIFQARTMGRYLRPRQAGTNRWAHIDEAAIIYTSKPDPFERALLTSLDIDPDAVVETRERDTIYQFVARTSLRDPDSERPTVAWVYDRAQAEALALSFAGRPEIDVELKLTDLGFAHEAPLRKSLKSLNVGEKLERQRAQARERKRRQRAKGKVTGGDVSPREDAGE